MIEQFFTQPKVLSRLREGVFGQNLPAFAASLHKEGYSRGCIRRHLRAADHSNFHLLLNRSPKLTCLRPSARVSNAPPVSNASVQT